MEGSHRPNGHRVNAGALSLTKIRPDAGGMPDGDLAAIPPWIARMRAAATEALKESDIQEIVRKQVEKAKAGDQNAIRFVFDQLLAVPKGLTFVQNNFHGEDQPQKPTPAMPGSKQKVSAMEARAAAGLPLCADQDGPERDLD